MRLQDALRGVIQAQEEPFGDPSIMAHGFLMDAARQAKVPVILGGQGGDELLFGYPWMSSGLAACAMRNGRIVWASHELRQLALSPALRARVCLAAFAPALEKLARKQSRLSKRNWLSRRFRRHARSSPSMGPASDIVALQLEAVEQVAIPHLTHYDDRNGMARSIECRMPFLDHRLAEVLAELEPAAFLSNGVTKRVLRQAVADLLPQAVLERRDKVGFFTPLEVMMQREADWVRSLVLDDLARQLDFYQFAEIERCLAVCQRTADDPQAALRLWRCLAVRVWAEQFNIRPLV
jgi:asparagine synthase (glutamine-hydrolysing)